MMTVTKFVFLAFLPLAFFVGNALSEASGMLPKSNHKQDLLISCFQFISEWNYYPLKIAYFLYSDADGATLKAINSFNILHTIFTEHGLEKLRQNQDFQGAVMFVNLPFNETLQVISTQRFSNYVIFSQCRRLQEYFQGFFQRHIKNVIGLCFDDAEMVQFYTFEPYAQCHKLQGLHFGTCSLSSSSVKRQFVLARIPREIDLKGCPVNISLLYTPQAVVFENGKLEGWEVMVLNDSIKSLNGTPSYRIVFQSMPRQFVQKELNGTAEIVGGMMMNAPSQPDQLIVRYGLQGTYSWVVPMRISKTSPWTQQRTILFFPLQMWSLMSLATIMCILALILMKNSLRFSLSALKSFFGHPLTNPRNKSWLTKIFLLFWFAFTLVVSSSYQAAVANSLTLRPQVLRLRDLQDIVKSNCTVLCAKNNYLFYLMDLVTFNKELAPLKRRIQILPNNTTVENVLIRVANERNVVYLEKQEQVQYAMSQLEFKVISKLHVQTKSAEKFPSPFILRKQSPIRRALVHKFARITESGIADKLKSIYTSKNERNLKLIQLPHSMEGARALALTDMDYAIWILFTGFTIAGYCLLLEHMYLYWETRKKHARAITISGMCLTFSLLLYNWEDIASVPEDLRATEMLMNRNSSLGTGNGFSTLNKRILPIKNIYEEFIADLPAPKGDALRIAYFAYGPTQDFPAKAVNNFGMLQTIFAEPYLHTKHTFFISPGVNIFLNMPFKQTLGRLFRLRFSNYVVSDECNSLKNHFREFLNERIVNVVGICVDKSENILIYTFDPFNRSHCNTVKDLILLDKWKGTPLTVNHIAKRFGGVYRYNGCPVNATLFIRPPAVIQTEKGPDGWDVWILLVAIRETGGDPHLKLVQESSEFEVVEKELNVSAEVMGGMLLTHLSQAMVHPLFCGVRASMVWVVPKRKNYLGALKFITSTFSSTLWLLLFLTIFANTGYCCIFVRRQTGCGWKKSLLMSIEFSCYSRHPLRRKLDKYTRFYIVLWMFYVTTVEAAFQAGLGSLLTTKVGNVKLATFNDILKSQLPIVCKQKSYDFFLKTFLEELNDRGVSALSDRLIILPQEEDIRDILLRVAREKNIVYIEVLERLNYVMASMDRETLSSLYIQKAVFNTFGTPFLIHIHSPIRRGLQTKFFQLSESGLSGKVQKEYNSKLEGKIKLLTDTDEVHPLGLGEISDAVIVLALGLSVSTCIFIMENFLKQIKRSKWFKSK